MEKQERQLQITSIEDLQRVASGTVVELPPFVDGTPFVAKLKRPSMFVLAKTGKIPNSLLKSANALFADGVAGSFDTMDEAMLSKCFDLFDVICEASFVEPRYEQIREAGIELTDEQYMFVFGYAQNGVRQLESFRQ